MTVPIRPDPLASTARRRVLRRIVRKDTARRSTEGPPRPSGEQYIADLPGVGAGLLDTLRTVYGKRLEFDTASANPGMLGEFQPRWRRLGRPARVLVNPRAFEQVDNPEEAPTMLGHEVIGHGMAGVGPWPWHQEAGDEYGRALVELSGRRSIPKRETKAGSFVRSLLDRLSQAR